jgi:tetratricopeptide (TPR) repeat protein
MATISEALALAIQHQQAGGLQAAERICRQILAVQSDQADAWHVLGLVAHQAGQHEAAARCIESAIRFNPRNAEMHNSLGNVYITLHRTAEALACCHRAVALQPGFAEAHYCLGNLWRMQGELHAAVASYRRALELRPDDFRALNNLGVVLKDQGQLEEAVACYRRVLELRPNDVEPYNNLGIALCDQGHPDQAIACYQRALQLAPGDPELHYNLGAALKDQGRLDEAVACYHRALELKPDYAKAHSNLGNTLRDQGKTQLAIACYRRALELEPDFVDAYVNLGAALSAQGRHAEAVAYYRRALELKPDYVEAHNNLGIALNELGKPNEAVACHRRAVELRPDFPEAHNNLGIALKEQGKLDEALACHCRALELRPDFAEAHASLGSALEEIGDLAGAEDAFRTALRHDRRFAVAHYKLAELLGGKLSQQDLAAQRSLLDEMELTDAQRASLHFGLAHALDAQGEYAQAAAHIERGNSLQRSEWKKRGEEYDPKSHELFVTRTISACTPDFFQRVRGFGLDSRLPVFVVGLPRSGTTLVEQILASHSQVFGAGETKLVSDSMTALGEQGNDVVEGLRRLDRQTAQRLASRHLERLRALDMDGRALRIVDKMPDNYLYLGLVASLFPRAKLIHCRRDLRDVAVSCWKTHFREVHWAGDQQHIASRFHEYQRVMEHWRRVLPLPLLEVDYEETVADLEGTARKLVAWCGLEWEPACLEFQQAKRQVRTASAVQVRQPIYTTSIDRWKHYVTHLEPLLRALSPQSDAGAIGGPRGIDECDNAKGSPDRAPRPRRERALD